MIGRIFSRAAKADATLHDYVGRDVYGPDFQTFARQTGLDQRALSRDQITIATSLFRFLMSLWLRRVPFDTEHYLKRTPMLCPLS